MKFRHKKRGTDYTVFDIIEYSGIYLIEGDKFPYYESYEQCFADFQSSNGPFNNGLVVLYYSNDSGKEYARPAVEFFDGRFERI